MVQNKAETLQLCTFFIRAYKQGFVAGATNDCNGRSRCFARRMESRNSTAWTCQLPRSEGPGTHPS